MSFILSDSASLGQLKNIVFSGSPYVLGVILGGGLLKWVALYTQKRNELSEIDREIKQAQKEQLEIVKEQLAGQSREAKELQEHIKVLEKKIIAEEDITKKNLLVLDLANQFATQSLREGYTRSKEQSKRLFFDIVSVYAKKTRMKPEKLSSILDSIWNKDFVPSSEDERIFVCLRDLVGIAPYQTGRGMAALDSMRVIMEEHFTNPAQDRRSLLVKVTRRLEDLSKENSAF